MVSDKEMLEKVKEVLTNMLVLMVEVKDKVSVNFYHGSGYLFEVMVDERDFGKVIGKKGRIAQSIRIILNAIGGKINKKIIVNFLHYGKGNGAVKNNKQK